MDRLLSVLSKEFIYVRQNVFWQALIKQVHSTLRNDFTSRRTRDPDVGLIIIEQQICLIDLTVHINQLVIRWKRVVIYVLNGLVNSHRDHRIQTEEEIENNGCSSLSIFFFDSQSTLFSSHFFLLELILSSFSFLRSWTPQYLSSYNRVYNETTHFTSLYLHQFKRTMAVSRIFSFCQLKIIDKLH
jgi:hypothetical protein